MPAVPKQHAICSCVKPVAAIDLTVLRSDSVGWYFGCPRGMDFL
jgi:hypothetical protein